MNLKKVQDVSVSFLEAIEDDNPGTRVILSWAMINGNECGTGIIMGKGVGQDDLKTALFQINGRAYDLAEGNKPQL